MDWARGTYAGEQKYILGFGKEHWKKRDHLEDVGVEGRIIRISILKKEYGGQK
jgi:hypothetical protein